MPRSRATLGHLANPEDVEKAALDHPDLTFIIYHSAIKHGPSEPEFKKDGFFDPDDRRLRLARRADEDQAAQSEDEQRLSRDRLGLRHAGDRRIPRCAST